MGKASKRKGGRKPAARRSPAGRERQAAGDPGPYGESRLPAGYSEDDQVPVIITTGNRKPPGAGKLIGMVNSEAVLDDGTVLLPGAHIWHRTGPAAEGEEHTITFRDLARSPVGAALPIGPDTPRPAASIPGLRDRTLENRVQARMEAQSPGLAAKLSRGLGKDELAVMAPEIVQAMRAAGAGPGTYDFGGQPGAVRTKLVTGSPVSRDLPYGLKPGDMIAGEQPLGYTETGITLPDGTSIEPGAKVWRPDPRLVITDKLPDDADDASMVIEDLDPEDPDSGRVLIGNAAQVRRYHAEMSRRPAPAGIAERSHENAPRTREEAEAILLRTGWDPDTVLDQHAWLTHHYRNPGDDLCDYLAFAMRETIGKDSRAITDFWPVNLRETVADLPEGRTLAGIISRGLGESPTFQVTELMVRTMQADWKNSGADPMNIGEAELPVPAGFAWLDKPWLLNVNDGWTPVRAVSWEKTSIPVWDYEPGDKIATRDFVRVVLWLLIADDVAFNRWDDDLGRADQVAAKIGRLIPQHMVLLPFGTRVNARPEQQDGIKSELGLLHTLWKYLGMILPKSRPVQAKAGAVRKRAQRSLRHDEVHVVTLRQFAYIEDTPATFPRQVGWSCRWWVREFYRHIDHYEDTDETGRRCRHEATPAGRTGNVTEDEHDVCAVCLARGQTVRITLVHTYDKGPAGLPFRKPAPERTIYKLAR